MQKARRFVLGVCSVLVPIGLLVCQCSKNSQTNAKEIKAGDAAKTQNVAMANSGQPSLKGLLDTAYNLPEEVKSIKIQLSGFDEKNSIENQLKEIVKTKVTTPDSFLAIGENRFLVTISQIAAIKQGLYFVDMQTGECEQFCQAIPRVTELFICAKTKNPDGIMVKATYMQSGKMFTDYSAIMLARRPANPQFAPIASFVEDGESGKCGDSKERAKAIGLNVSTRPTAVIPFGCCEDSSFQITFSDIHQIDCASRQAVSYEHTYLYRSGTFSFDTDTIQW